MSMQNAKKSPIVSSISADVWRSECERVALKLMGELSNFNMFPTLSKFY